MLFNSDLSRFCVGPLGRVKIVRLWFREYNNQTVTLSYWDSSTTFGLFQVKPTPFKIHPVKFPIFAALIM